MQVIVDFIANVIIEYLFGALFKVLYVYRLPATLRAALALLVVLSYGLIEYFLVHEAIRCFHEGKTYLMWLCIVGAIVFGLLIVVGFLHQRKNLMQ